MGYTEDETTIKETLEIKWDQRSGTLVKLAPALSKAQGQMGPLVKGAKNPYFQSSYATLSGVLDVLREPFEANELSVIQEPSTSGNRLILTTTIMHSSGEYIRSSLEFPVNKPDPQGFGSAITYARRYALQSIVGVAAEDDDGNIASGKSTNDNRPAPAIPPKVQAKKLEKRQKLTMEAIAAKKAYQYDPKKVGEHYPSEEEKTAAWKVAIRDFGAVNHNGFIYTLNAVEEWYEFWLNEFELDSLPESFTEGVAQ